MRELLSPQYFRLFCQKFAGEFLPGFYETVCSAKRINEMGTHQLLLDLHNLKVCAAPSFGRAGLFQGERASPSFRR